MEGSKEIRFGNVLTPTAGKYLYVCIGPAELGGEHGISNIMCKVENQAVVLLSVIPGGRSLDEIAAIVSNISMSAAELEKALISGWQTQLGTQILPSDIAANISQILLDENFSIPVPDSVQFITI